MHKTVDVDDAEGLVLAHDITEIRKNEFKGRAFKKGHKIRKADICHLRRLGKQHVFVLDIEPGYSHEDDAAMALANAFCGSGVVCNETPREGKLTLFAATDGLLKVEVDALTAVNMLGEVMCACRHNNSVVKKGAAVAATRAIPLVIRSETVDEAVAISRKKGGLFRVNPIRKAKAGVIITGQEVLSGIIEDRFEPILRKKITALGSETIAVAVAPDDATFIGSEIKRQLQLGADLILTTGGMSVDPDDVTRLGIRTVTGDVDCYGTPVLPGAMFMIGFAGEVPILGVPACGIYHETTVLDLLLPRILAGEKPGRKDIAQLGHGGLCLNCQECRFPTCPFGKS